MGREGEIAVDFWIQAMVDFGNCQQRDSNEASDAIFGLVLSSWPKAYGSSEVITEETISSYCSNPSPAASFMFGGNGSSDVARTARATAIWNICGCEEYYFRSAKGYYRQNRIVQTCQAATDYLPNEKTAKLTECLNKK